MAHTSVEWTHPHILKIVTKHQHDARCGKNNKGFLLLLLIHYKKKKKIDRKLAVAKNNLKKL